MRRDQCDDVCCSDDAMCYDCMWAENKRLRKELTMARWTLEDGLRTAMTRSLTEWNEYVRRANSAIIHIDASLGNDKP